VEEALQATLVLRPGLGIMPPKARAHAPAAKADRRPLARAGVIALAVRTPAEAELLETLRPKSVRECARPSKARLLRSGRRCAKRGWRAAARSRVMLNPLPGNERVATIISLRGVTKTYGTGIAAFQALKGVDMDIQEGDFVAVMGPSGSGKSTLMNIIGCLDRPTAGTYVLDGDDVSTLDRDERAVIRNARIGFVFQNFNLFPGFTVEENVAWPLEFMGKSWREARRRAVLALEKVGVQTAAQRRRPAELSGGEQQRVAIARALVTEPQLLLADEPTGNLDSRTGQAILDLLRGLNVERRLTVVLVTHSTFAATYGRRTIELRDGRIAGVAQAQEGLPELRAVQSPELAD
jgi:putative ABC transport system ATP-binding protein